MIILASIFRDSTSYLERHRDQVERLRKIAREPVYVVAVEGDSHDDTYARLTEMEYVDEVRKVEHGGMKYGSVVHPLRWRQLSVCCNVAVCCAVRVHEKGDFFVYVESDLIWEPDEILALKGRLGESGVHAVAPMSMAWDAARFYDIWGHQKDGIRFRPYPPYYDGWTPHAHDLVEIDTAGSCFITDSYALLFVEFSAQDCIRGVGRSLREHGVNLYLDPTAKVFHP